MNWSNIAKGAAVVAVLLIRSRDFVAARAQAPAPGGERAPAYEPG